MGFVVEYAIGGAGGTSLGTVAGYMFGTHALIGIGEGVITAVTVMAVARSRPDLVYLLRDRTRRRCRHDSDAARILDRFAAATLLIAGVRLVLRQLAARTGLTPRRCRVARSSKPPTVKSSPATASRSTPPSTPCRTSPLADYAIGGQDGTGGIAGIIGVLVTVVVAGSAFWLIARSRRLADDKQT